MHLPHLHRPRHHCLPWRHETPVLVSRSATTGDEIQECPACKYRRAVTVEDGVTHVHSWTPVRLLLPEDARRVA